jgi:glycosyltransferase involved in cell wall biosynthesis
VDSACAPAAPQPSVSMRRPRVTACVVVKDRLEMMTDCLDALAGQQAVDHDVVVIDNGSTDGTYEMLAGRATTFPVPLTVQRVEGPLGRARQASLDHATAPIVAFTDSDCLPAPEWLAGMCARFTHRVDVVQGRTDPLVEPDGRWPKTMRVRQWSDRYETANIAYRTAALRAAGGFDERTVFYGEDTAAGWRVRGLGGRYVFAEAALVRHAVTYPGAGWHRRFARSLGIWPELVHQFPDMRREVLTARLFLRRRSAAFDLAALGVVLLAARRPVGLALLVPYARTLRPAWAADGLRGAAEVLSYDLNTAIGLIAGSWRARTVVL